MLCTVVLRLIGAKSDVVPLGILLLEDGPIAEMIIIDMHNK